MYWLVSRTQVFLLLGFVTFTMASQNTQAGDSVPLTLPASNFLTLEPGNSLDVVSLADLVSGEFDGVMVGDKIFSEFFYSTTGLDMPAPEDINVFGFQDNDGNYGLSFHGTFMDLPGGGPSDALLRFTVDVDPAAQEEGWRISDAHLFAGGIGVGDDSVFLVDESFQESNQTMSVFSSTLGQGGQQLSDWVDFDQRYTSLRVTKDIFALAGQDAFLPARATVIDQSFSQDRINIPEPTSMVLMALAGLGMVASVRRRRLGVGFQNAR